MPQMLVDEAPALHDAKCCTEMQGCSHRDSRVPARCLGAGRWNTAIRDLQERWTSLLVAVGDTQVKGTMHKGRVSRGCCWHIEHGGGFGNGDLVYHPGSGQHVLLGNLHVGSEAGYEDVTNDLNCP